MWVLGRVVLAKVVTNIHKIKGHPLRVIMTRFLHWIQFVSVSLGVLGQQARQFFQRSRMARTRT
jgi:hypothetical protein